MTNEELIALLERGVTTAAEKLVARIEAGEFSAADVAQLRGMFKDAGGTFVFNGRPTPAGDSVLESLADIDLDMLKH